VIVHDILQPDFTSVWADLDEETRAAVFPMIKDEARRAIIDDLAKAHEEKTRAEWINEKAAETLLWRDAKREADRLEAERSGAEDSWAPQPIADLFDTDQQVPEIGSFLGEDMTPSGGVFYRGKVNEVHGPSESGKTMFVLAVAAQEIEAERHVVMIDYEDDGRSIVNRLRHVFNMEREQIEKYFHYFRPDTPFTQAGMDHIAGIGDVSMCIIDAVTESMAVSQLDGRNENEVATWYNDFPKKLATLGMGVVLIDHTPQDNHNRQIGSQHKKSAVDGVSYTAEPIYPFVKGQLGHLRIRVAKDKIGTIRQAALPQGDGKQYWRGDFKLDGRPTATGPRVLVSGVTPIHQAAESKARDVKTVKECPKGLQPMLNVLAEDGEWFSTRELSKAIGRDDDTKDPALARTYATRLVKLGLVDRDARGKSVYFKISEEGKHTANAVANDQRFDHEETLDDAVRSGPSEQFANSPSEHSEQSSEQL
jgi:DNA-binding transcriptional ArsR family regulator